MNKDDLYTARWYAKELKAESAEGSRTEHLSTGLLDHLNNMIENQDKIPAEPERPSVTARPTIYSTPIKVKTRGNYKTPSGLPKGLIVHFTASRNDAENVLRYLGSEGLGCMVMDREGNIIKSQDQGLNEVAYHAGRSTGPRGETGMSFYCMGMEIISAGNLTKKQGKYYSWFNLEIDASEVRESTRDNANQKAGAYHVFTDAQEKSLIEFLKWQIRTNPEFDVEYVLGHDEVSPGRKVDPGFSLSMSMPDLRKILREYKANL